MLIFQKNAEVRGEDLKIPTHSDKWVGMGRGKKLRTSYMDSSDELNEAHWHKNMNWDMSSFRGFLINEAITSKNQITLVLLKNINIWLSYSPNMACMPIFGHTFFGHDSAIFGTIVLKNVKRTQETIIYRLVNGDGSVMLNIWFIVPLMARKWTWLPGTPLMVWGLHSRPKRWPTTISKSCFRNIQARTPPQLNINPYNSKNHTKKYLLLSKFS